jgi:hypothetical protein
MKEKRVAQRVDAGDGYRLLVEGDSIELGDEYLNHSNDWRPSNTTYGEWKEAWYRPMRRKINEQEGET